MEKLLIAFYAEYVIMFIKYKGDRYQNTKIPKIPNTTHWILKGRYNIMITFNTCFGMC